MVVINVVNVVDAFSNQPPRITDSKPVVVVAEGEDVELACAAQGYPVPTYTWHRNAQPIRQIAFNRIRQNDGSLRIGQVMLSDGGIYRCSVNNSVGSEMIETQLIVTGKDTNSYEWPTIITNEDIQNPIKSYDHIFTIETFCPNYVHYYHYYYCYYSYS